MKKMILFVAVITAAFSVFAQLPEYNQLLEKAKYYEAKDKLVYAMGFYADAISADSAYSEEAYAGLKNLIENITAGNPGNIQYTEEQMYDHWKELLIDAEKYWSEYCPYSFYLGPVELKSETRRTSDYWADVIIKYSEKYQLIMNAVEEGYRKSFDPSWNLPSPVREYSSDGFRYCSKDDYWPRVSVTKGNAKKSGYNYELTKKKEDFYKENVATIGFSSSGKNDYEPLFKRGQHLKIYTDTAIGEFYNAFAYHEPIDTYCETLYELRIGFMTKDGTVLQSPLPYIATHQLDSEEAGFKVEINGITSDKAKLFENGEVIPYIENVFIHIGFQTCEMYNKPDGEDFFFTENEIFILPKLPFITDGSIKIYYTDMGQKEGFAAFYFANTYREDLKQGLKGTVKKQSTEDGTLKYLDDLKYTEDFIEISIDGFNQNEPVRIPLWVFAQICSKEAELPASYDNYGNQINDKGYVVSLDLFNQYFTFRHLMELSPQQRAALLSKAMKKANKELAKKAPPFRLLSYYKSFDRSKYFEYDKITSLYNELETAIKSSNTKDITDLSEKIEKLYPQSKYEEANLKLKELEKECSEIDSLYLRSRDLLTIYNTELKDDIQSKETLEQIASYLKEYEENILTSEEFETKLNEKENLEQLPFEKLEQRVPEYKKELKKNKKIFNRKTKNKKKKSKTKSTEEKNT